MTHSASDDHHEAPTLPPGKSKPASDDHHEAPTLPPGAKLPAGAAEEVQWSLEGPTLGNAPSIPEQFGRYRILKKLGSGGMADVYLAEDPLLDRRVAIKVPFFAEEDKDATLSRFLREARAVAALQHPNICPIHEVGEVDGVHFMAMAYIEGKPLSEFIRPDKPLPIRTAVKLVRRLALALEAAHDQGVIHRDLKPANIMINRRGEPIIMDFGLARREGKEDAPLTRTGEIMGTPHYMSPEQVSGNVAAMGPGCDIYSLGVVLYELLTARPPFTGDLLALLSQIALDDAKPPSKHREEIDPQLDDICLKAMAKQPVDRHLSMGDFANALSDYLLSGGEDRLLAELVQMDAAAPATPAATMPGTMPPSPGAGLQAPSGPLFAQAQQKELGNKGILIAVWAAGGTAALAAVAIVAMIVMRGGGENGAPPTPPEPVAKNGTSKARQILVVPPAQVASEKIPHVFSTARGNSISITNVDAGTEIQIVLSVKHGTLTFSGITGLTFSTGDGTADTAVAFSGTPGTVNTALDRLIYTPNWDYLGDDALRITVILQGNQGNTGSLSALSGTDKVGITVRPLLIDGKQPTTKQLYEEVFGKREWILGPKHPETLLAKQAIEQLRKKELEQLRKKESDSFAGTKAGQAWDGNGLKLKFCWCPPGRFTMGSPKNEKDRDDDDEDQVSVTLTRGFWLGKYEVTRSQWKSVMATQPWAGKKYVKEGDDYAALYISWEDAVKFCAELTKQDRLSGKLPDGWAYRLPTEAQWEYGCRAGSKTRYGFGDAESRLGDYGWYWIGKPGLPNAKNAQYAHRVGIKRANGWGLHDLHGNVSEWCQDWYKQDLPGGTDPEVTTKAEFRVNRGGCWDLPSRFCRCADRWWAEPTYLYGRLGFRLAAVQVRK